MLALFDSHCHLDFDDFNADRTVVLTRAKAAGVQALMIPGVSRNRPAVPLPMDSGIRFFHGFGLHPYFIDHHDLADLDWLEQQLQTHPTAAVGEVGLDRHCRDYQRQVELFVVQVELACRYQRPLIIHHRQSQPDLLKYVTPYRSRLVQPAGVIHAFSGSYQQAHAWLQLGFMLGVGGIISYPRANKTRSTIAKLPLEQLVLETDAPDMPLAGYQGQRNEPAQVALVARCLAELVGYELQQVAEQTTANAYRLFASR